MIKYTLKCDQGHSFESWFQSSDAYEDLRAAGRLTCLDCGSTSVEKTLMAPKIGGGVKIDPAKALAAFKSHVESNCDYFGPDFASEARAMQDGTAPDRPIYGEAKPAEAKALIDDGIPVAPLPFTPTRKVN
ncbi:DUF1178 family protein [Aestuariibius insulae]|uniref:DUF1178 family protein n=1 Tax=Aestuariibius insulae TaxID=2058287 RepID=UPI00345EEF7F